MRTWHTYRNTWICWLCFHKLCVTVNLSQLAALSLIAHSWTATFNYYIIVFLLLCKCLHSETVEFWFEAANGHQLTVNRLTSLINFSNYNTYTSQSFLSLYYYILARHFLYLHYYNMLFRHYYYIHVLIKHIKSYLVIIYIFLIKH